MKISSQMSKIAKESMFATEIDTMKSDTVAGLHCSIK